VGKYRVGNYWGAVDSSSGVESDKCSEAKDPVKCGTSVLPPPLRPPSVPSCRQAHRNTNTLNRWLEL